MAKQNNNPDAQSAQNPSPSEQRSDATPEVVDIPNYTATTYGPTLQSDASAVAKLANRSIPMLSVTLFRRDLRMPAIIDPAHLDYMQLLRVGATTKAPIRDMLMLTLSKWGCIKNKLDTIIPRAGSFARWRRGVTVFNVDEIIDMADEMVTAAQGDKRAEPDMAWVGPVKTIVHAIVLAAFHPLQITVGIKPTVAIPQSLDLYPTYQTILNVAHIAALKDAFVAAPPDSCFAGIDLLVMADLAEALRVYFTKLLRAIAESTFKVTAHINTALSILREATLFKLGIESTSSVSIPASQMISPHLDTLITNETVQSILEKAYSKYSQGVLQPHEYDSSIAVFEDTVNCVDYFNQRTLKSMKGLGRVTDVKSSAGRRSALIVSFKQTRKPDFRAFDVSASPRSLYAELYSANATNASMAGAITAIATVPTVDEITGVGRLLARRSLVDQRDRAIVYTAASSEKEYDRALELMAAAFATETLMVAVPDESREDRIARSFVYRLTVSGSSYEQPLADMSEHFITSDVRLALYLSASEGPQTESLLESDYDSAVLVKGLIPLAAYRADGKLSSPDWLKTDLGTITNVGRNNATMTLGLVRNYLAVDCFTTTVFSKQPGFTKDVMATFAATLDAVKFIDDYANQLKLDADTVMLEKRYAVAPLYETLVRAGATGFFGGRLQHAAFRMIGAAPTSQAARTLEIDLRTPALRAQMAVTVLLKVLVAMSVLEDKNSKRIQDIFDELKIHERLGAYLVGADPRPGLMML